jgi:hypothetical protein
MRGPHSGAWRPELKLRVSHGNQLSVSKHEVLVGKSHVHTHAASCGRCPLRPCLSMSWEATLEWDVTSGVDRFNLDGAALAVSFQVTSVSPTVTPDPNGTQAGYFGTGTISFDGVAVAIASSRVSFFNPTNPLDGAVANFFLDPVSGNPVFYYPALLLAPGANATSATAAPLYSSGQILDAFLLVAGVDANDSSLNARYRMQIISFASSDTASAIPEPSGLALAIAGALLMFAWRKQCSFLKLSGCPKRDKL